MFSLSLCTRPLVTRGLIDELGLLFEVSPAGLVGTGEVDFTTPSHNIQRLSSDLAAV